MEKFSIHINEESIETGTICLGWIVPPKVFDSIDASGIIDPQVLIIISPVEGYSYYKEHREMRPLKDLIGYFEMHTKGEHYIRAFICENDNRWTGMQSGVYSETLLNTKGDDWYNYIRSFRPLDLYSDPLIVDVPEGVFAAEPPAWEKVWVNWLTKGKAIDQCHYRKRRLFAYTIQPAIFIGSFAINVILTICSYLIGSRGANLNSIIHPLDFTIPGNTEDLFYGGLKNISFDEDKSLFERIKRIWLTPGFAIAIVFIGLHCSGLLRNYPRLDGVALGYTMFAGIAFMAVMLLSSILSFHVYQQYRKQVKPVWYKNGANQALLSKKNVRLSDLPTNAKIMKLRFLDLKQRICRPFSR